MRTVRAIPFHLLFSASQAKPRQLVLRKHLRARAAVIANEETCSPRAFAVLAYPNLTTPCSLASFEPS